MNDKMARVFDGVAEAFGREKILREQVDRLAKKPTMVSVYFKEDSASVLYTRLKQEVAGRVGIGFTAIEQSFADEAGVIREKIRGFNLDDCIQGVMIQKPSKRTWNDLRFKIQDSRIQEFNQWWRELADTIDPKKDVDCLTSINLEKVESGVWKIVPATVRAVLAILARAAEGLRLNAQGDHFDPRRLALDIEHKHVVVIGQSEIVGKPLAAVLEHKGAIVNLVGSGEQDLKKLTFSADILVSATGRPKLITGDMVKEGAVVVDVGSPQGDVDFEGVAKKASFITPVPDGVGPMTVVSLLENLVELVGQHSVD